MNPKGLGKATPFLAAGVGLAGSVVGGLAIGYYGDEFLGTSPVLMATLPLLAMAGAVYRLVRMYDRQRERRRKQNDRSQ